MAKPGRKPKLTVVGSNGSGNLTHDNTKNALNDDELHALTLQHRRHYEAALKAKKAADASFKNVCKKAIADLGETAIIDIKDLIAADEDEKYEEKLIAELERKARIARWQGIELGTQGNLFESTAPSQRERAHALGKREALEGKPCKTDFSPGTEGYDGYMEGWHAGSAIKSNMDKEQEEGATLLLRPQENEPAGPDAFDSAADNIPDTPPAPADEEQPAPAAEASESEPWPDDVQVADREPAEVL